MIEILWHGRGGQGAFTAARILGTAYVNQGNNAFALAFPSFGPERRGAPIRAFTKLSSSPIGDRSEIKKADYSVFLDETLLTPASLEELKEGGKLIVNTKKHLEDSQVICVDGDAIAQEILQLPITNTIMLGALAAVCEHIDLSAIEQAIRESMPLRLQEKNIAAVREAFRSGTACRKEGTK
ncbi:MAG: 2-oxoacid:acceptor oxidoreductase family protein [Parasporobacterium sp.]|nr:2-oxoacid:acceptor oxidoreductase family protein [Parasporobacterium sp.]